MLYPTASPACKVASYERRVSSTHMYILFFFSLPVLIPSLAILRVYRITEIVITSHIIHGVWQRRKIKKCLFTYIVVIVGPASDTVFPRSLANGTSQRRSMRMRFRALIVSRPSRPSLPEHNTTLLCRDGADARTKPKASKLRRPGVISLFMQAHH